MASKNSLITLLFSGMALLAGCLTSPSQDPLTKKIMPDSNRWTQLNENPPKSEEEILWFLDTHIKYVGEKGESWMSPEVAVTRGYGDCDERAFLGAYLSGKLGYSREIIAVAKKEKEGFSEGHVFTLLHREENGHSKYGLLDNYLLMHPEYDSASELIKTANRESKKSNPKHKDWDHYKIINIDSCFQKDWMSAKNDLYNPSIQFEDYVRVE